MAKGARIQVKGLKELKLKIGQIPRAIVEEIDPEFSAAANDFANKAEAAAPKDEGILRQGISSYRLGEMNYAVVSSGFQSAYMEWGTKRRAKIPSDLTAYAAQFKGKSGGDNQGFYDSILAWVKRKGLTGTYSVKTKKRTGNKTENQIEDEQVAFAIYLSILRHGVHGHPFFFQHRDPVYKALKQKLQPTVEKAMKK